MQVQADECDIVAGYSGFPNTTTAHLHGDMIMSVAVATMCNDRDIFYCLLENQSYKLAPTNLHVFVANGQHPTTDTIRNVDTITFARIAGIKWTPMIIHSRLCENGTGYISPAD